VFLGEGEHAEHPPDTRGAFVLVDVARALFSAFGATLARMLTFEGANDTGGNTASRSSSLPLTGMGGERAEDREDQSNVHHLTSRVR
jgi:hypothetical protein